MMCQRLADYSGGAIRALDPGPAIPSERGRACCRSWSGALRPAIVAMDADHYSDAEGVGKLAFPAEAFAVDLQISA